MYYFKGDTAKKWFDDLNNGIDFFKKIHSDGIKLEEAKKTSRIYLNQINTKYQEEDLNQKIKKWH